MDAPSDNIAAVNLGTAIPNAQLRAKFFVHFMLEESDLTLIVVSETEISVSDNPLASNAHDSRYFRHVMSPRRFAVVTNKVVPLRNE